MTQSEFIKQYCENSNIDEKVLNGLWQFAIPCECGSDDCGWWVMIKKDYDTIKNHIDLHFRK